MREFLLLAAVGFVGAFVGDKIGTLLGMALSDLREDLKEWLNGSKARSAKPRAQPR